MLKRLLFGLFCFTVGVGVERLAVMQTVEMLQDQCMVLKFENWKLQAVIGPYKLLNFEHLQAGHKRI